MNFLQSSINLDTQESSIIEKYELSKIDYSNNESNVNALENEKEKLVDEIQNKTLEEKKIEKL